MRRAAGTAAPRWPRRGRRTGRRGRHGRRPSAGVQDQARVPPRAAAIRHGSDGSGRGAPDSGAAAWGFGVRREIDLGGNLGRGGNDGDDATKEEEERRWCLVLFGPGWVWDFGCG